MALYPNLNVEDPGLAHADARRAIPARAVAGDRPARDQRGRLLRPRQGIEQHRAAAQPAVPAGVPHRVDASTTSRPPTRCSIRSGSPSATPRGLRLLPDGRPMEIVVDTAGESTEETDVLELVRDSWRKLGIALFSRPSVREVFRKRVYSGKSMMTVWSGLNNGIPTSEMSPNELAPTAQEQLQWPMWGQYYENNRKGGEAPALPEAKELVELYDKWRVSASAAEREQIWLRMLEIHAQQVYTIGIVIAGAAADRGQEQAAQRSRPRASTAGTRDRISACITRTRSGWNRRSRADAALRREPRAADDPDDDRDQHHRLHHHPAAAGQLPRELHRRAAGAGRIGRSAEDRLPEARSTGSTSPSSSSTCAGPAACSRATSAIRSNSTCR